MTSKKKKNFIILQKKNKLIKTKQKKNNTYNKRNYKETMKEINNIILVLIVIVIIHFIIDLHKERGYKKKQEKDQNQINNSTKELFSLKNETNKLKDLYGSLFIKEDDGKYHIFSKETETREQEKESINNETSGNDNKTSCHPDKLPDGENNGSTKCNIKNKQFLNNLSETELREMNLKISEKLESKSDKHHLKHHGEGLNHKHNTCKCGCGSDTCDCKNGGCGNGNNNNKPFEITLDEDKLREYNRAKRGKNKLVYY
jgi:hypothetical protein